MIGAVEPLTLAASAPAAGTRTRSLTEGFRRAHCAGAEPRGTVPGSLACTYARRQPSKAGRAPGGNGRGGHRRRSPTPSSGPSRTGQRQTRAAQSQACCCLNAVGVLPTSRLKNLTKFEGSSMPS